MEKLDNSITWFEIPVTDFDRAMKFYNTIFDYEMPHMDNGSVRMGFLQYEIAEHRVGGAICQGPGYVPSLQGVLAYLNAGSDLTAVLNRVEGAGGKIQMPKTFIRDDIGYFAHIIDTEGNKLALHSRK
jgi:uncharacterized protein